MDETPIPRPTRPYLVVTLIVALLVGAAAGLIVGVMAREAWIGFVVGAAVAVLIGASSLLAVRRGGRGTVEGAPPWTGDAGARFKGGSV